MDIETTGVKKYAFQDLVCISLLLNLHFTENVQFFVEPENSEDAKLITDDLNGINEIEIQGEFKHEVRQFQKPYDNQQAEQISLMV